MRQISKRQDKEQRVTRRINIVIRPVYWSGMHIHSARIHTVREITLTSLIAYLAEPPKRHPNPDIESSLAGRWTLFFLSLSHSFLPPSFLSLSLSLSLSARLDKRERDLSPVRFNRKMWEKEIIIRPRIPPAKLLSLSLPPALPPVALPPAPPPTPR